MSSAKHYVCKCFFTDNYFVKRYGLHLRFESEKQVFQDYNTVLQRKGCTSERQFTLLYKELRQEKDRRINIGSDSLKRIKDIKNKYTCLHPHVYNLQDSFLHNEFIALASKCAECAFTQGSLASQLKHNEVPNVYQLQVFSQEFCRDLLQELEHFEATDLPKGRPNTMNNFGLLLDEIGFNPKLLDPLRTKYLEPICKTLYPECVGNGLDSHKAFIVKYKIGEDLDLSYHYDNAEVTLNVCLGKDFTGGNLYFGGMNHVALHETECSDCKHIPSFGVLHRGQHMHGALPIESGERYNLIMWMRSSSIRNKKCPMCHQTPSLIENPGRGDGFTQDSVDVCSAS